MDLHGSVHLNLYPSGHAGGRMAQKDADQGGSRRGHATKPACRQDIPCDDRHTDRKYIKGGSRGHAEYAQENRGRARTRVTKCYCHALPV